MKIAKAKKKAKAKAIKDEKIVEARAIARKMIEDKADKNVETFIQKKQTNKCKTALSNNSIAKKSNKR